MTQPADVPPPDPNAPDEATVLTPAPADTPHSADPVAGDLITKAHAMAMDKVLGVLR